MDALTGHDRIAVRAIPIADPGNTMEGCLHTLRGAYLKRSAREFIAMLDQSVAMLRQTM